MTVGLLSDRDRLYDRAALALCAVVAVIIALTFQVPGLAWDDHYQSRYGDLILDHIASGFTDPGVFEYGNMAYYGGLFDATAQLLVRVLPFEDYQTRHLLTAATGWLGLIGAWRFARELGGAGAGLLVLVLLTATPSYIGHMYINAKDIPFAAGYIWTLYFAARAAPELPKVSPRLALTLGVVLGATLGVRIGGVLLVGYLGLLVIQHYAWRGARSRIQNGVEEIAALAQTVLIVAMPAFALAFVLWPAAWANPLLVAIEAVKATADFRFEIDVLLNGVMYPSTTLPLHYVPTYMAVKLPEIVVIGFLFSLPVMLRLWGQAIVAGERRWGFGATALMLGLWFPPIYAMVAGSVHYDEIRHFLFILPPLCVVTALGLTEVGRWLFQHGTKWWGIVVALLFIGVGVSVMRTVTLFPYSYVAYNVFVGEVEGAAGRYEMDYWAVSYKEAAQGLSALMITDTEPYTVYVCGPQPSARPFLDQRARVVGTLQDADFFIAFTRANCDQRIIAPNVVDVVKNSARLSVVKDLRGGFDIVGKTPKTISLEPEN